MPKIAEEYPFGDPRTMSLEELANTLKEMYRDLAIAINKKPDVYFDDADAPTDAVYLSDGDLWVNQDSGNEKVQILERHDSTSAVTWLDLYP